MVYVTLNHFFPVPGASSKFEEVDVSEEAGGDDKTDEESNCDKKEDMTEHVKGLKA